ncbi:ABC transporter ATP-binding protein [Agrobacterium tumefaciens]|uniref:ABC transporter ATP-binding protein n=1 Tax=Agrobacterium tumefaciens TaxID=358 RepID=UPI00054D5192|nr:ABC transporter ATP-binding protein [Agrobacterium tumefaciens]
MTHNAPVTFTGVEKRYGSTTVLSDFNLEIKAGEFVTLLGPSGSGKTTALNALAGFVDISAGDILIGKKSVSRMAPEERGIGMVFQSYSLFPHMNVFDNVAFPLKLRKVNRSEIRRRVEEALAKVRLADFAQRMPKELSGGQRQRVAFARAVVFEPPVLLMDEPLSALDLKLREAMRLEIKRYHSESGCTIVFVTHDQSEALSLSDRIAVMGGGRILQIDTPRVVYDRPNSKFVADFIGQTNFLTSEFINCMSAPLNEGVDLGELRAGNLSIRPEHLRIGLPAADADIVFDCEVDEVLFLGESTEFSLKSATGQLLIAKYPAGTSDRVYRRGDRVQVSFRLSDAVSLSD